MIIGLVGPSGAGKTTLLLNIMRVRPDAHPLLSFTTREKRDTDLRGEYQYLTDAEYDAMLARDEFLKPAEARGKRYGTRKADIAEALESTELYFPILVPSVLKDFYELAFHLHRQHALHFIYLRALDEEQLRQRLKSRGDNEEKINRGLAESLPWNEETQTLGVRFSVIDATQTPEEVCRQALDIIGKETKQRPS